MMISENATQAKDNFPSALDAVGAAVRFIASEVLESETFASASDMILALTDATEPSFIKTKSYIVQNHDIGHRVIHRYFAECVKETVSRDLVEKALGTLRDGGQIKAIILGVINENAAVQAAAKAEAERARAEADRITKANAAAAADVGYRFRRRCERGASPTCRKVSARTSERRAPVSPSMHAVMMCSAPTCPAQPSKIRVLPALTAKRHWRSTAYLDCVASQTPSQKP